MQKQDGLPSHMREGQVITVHQGDCSVSGDNSTTFSTVLGSCISACVRDEKARIGGMNHFLLSEQSESSKDQFGASARYGAYAMEQLINQVLSKGSGLKNNLVIKVFGGGNINSKLTDIGAANAAFVRGFLADEGYKIAGEDLGGPFARRVLFQPESGRIFVKRLDSDIGETVVRGEIATAQAKPVDAPSNDDIELF